MAKSMQLIAGRTAQEFNLRKGRGGAFWEDRYHATAIDSNDYLRRCLVYIDLNMVRAGVVKHPSEWSQSGFNEIQFPPKRYQLIDQEKLCQLIEIESVDKLRASHAMWVKDTLAKTVLNREELWTSSLAVGGKSFIDKYLETAGMKVNYREVVLEDDCHVVKEPCVAYSDDL